jgi:hypothetical protein
MPNAKILTNPIIKIIAKVTIIEIIEANPADSVELVICVIVFCMSDKSEAISELF